MTKKLSKRGVIILSAAGIIITDHSLYSSGNGTQINAVMGPET